MENDRQCRANSLYLQTECLEMAAVPASASETKVEQKLAIFLRKLAWLVADFTISWHHPVM